VDELDFSAMKYFAIGDGDKRIECADRYLADLESDQTVVIWDPDQIDIPIRVTAITVTPKDPADIDIAFWGTINKAKEKGSSATVVGDKAIYYYREHNSGNDHALHFYEVGMGCHYSIFSITVDLPQESSPEFQCVTSDLESMISTLEERAEEQQFSSSLLQSDMEFIDAAIAEMLPSGPNEAAFDSLQQALDQAMLNDDSNLAAKVGIAFGDLLKDQLPSFSWAVKTDDWGRARSLDLGDTHISIFPEAMILKRLERKEKLNLREFSEDTIATVEKLFREDRAER
jgi:Domain of unknown function (DUF3806)